MSAELAGGAHVPPDLSNRYEAIKRLGHGGMGEVFLCHKLGMDGKHLKLVVLKRVLPHLADERKATEQFMQEMATAATLAHPNIVRVNDWGRFHGSNCFEMELIEGMSIEDLLRHRSPEPDKEDVLGALPPADVAWVGMQTCLGLAYAHTKGDGDKAGVVHRDISPDNLMVTLDGRVKIADWGVAKPLMSSDGMATGTRHAIGKAHYMAPEQWAGRPLDGRADLYALGATLVQMLSGRQLYPTREGEDILQFIQRVVAGQRPSVREMLPDAPPALQDVIEQMLTPDREHRPPSAESLVDRFEVIARELGGGLHAAQKAFATRIVEHYAKGSPTEPYLEPPKMTLPARSEKRLIATKQDRPAPTAGTQTGPMDSPFAQLGATPQTAELGVAHPTAQLSSTEQTAQPLAQVPPSRAGPLLWAALGAGIVLVALLAGLVGFLFADPGPGAEANDDEANTVTPPPPSPVDEPALTAAPAEPTAAAQTTEPARAAEAPELPSAAPAPTPTARERTRGRPVQRPQPPAQPFGDGRTPRPRHLGSHPTPQTQHRPSSSAFGL